MNDCVLNSIALKYTKVGDFNKIFLTLLDQKFKYKNRGQIDVKVTENMY